MSSVKYFAYGSNMSTSRMKDRIPTASPLGIGRLKGYKFCCNKKSNDGSAKGNLLRSDGSEVWGVVFEINKSDLAVLDEYEGGYQRINVEVIFNNKTITASTYISKKFTEELPLKSYMKLIIEGAIEHGLPEDYVATLKALQTKK